MMITSIMYPIQLFQKFQGFNCIADIKILVFAIKKNTQKGIRDPWTQIHSHQFDAAKLVKKIFERVWDSNFQQSGQIKFANFLHLAPIMVAPHGSLNTWNHWINDQPLYQSLFQPLIQGVIDLHLQYFGGQFKRGYVCVFFFQGSLTAVYESWK